MAGSNESVEQITSACATATQALEAIGNLQCRDIRNLASSTATGSVSSSCNPSTSGSSAIAAELGRRFPTFNARGGRTNSRKRSSSASNHETSSRSHSSKLGRGERREASSFTSFLSTEGGHLLTSNILFDYLKVSMGNIRSSCHVPLVVICRPFHRYARSYLAFR